MNDHENFGKLEDRYASFENAAVLLQPIPYDGTSTWGKGSDKGFIAFLEAAKHMELYDIETDTEVYKKGICILPDLISMETPEAMVRRVYQKTKELLSHGRFLTFFGGEHSISIGILKAFYEEYSDISILHLDAHTDLRSTYKGTPYNHGCALHEASKNANLVQVGIRSMDASELAYFDKEKCFLSRDIYGSESWMDRAIELLGEKVYITLDLDVFDPSIMPSTGTPEPGGLDWYTVTSFLRKVFAEKDVLGFDIVELAPIEGLRAPDFLAAKLFYKMLGYKFNLKTAP